MPFTLEKVVPWGRNLQEYVEMFDFDVNNQHQRIISFGDGPSSFNSEMLQFRRTVTSIDPIYQFSKQEIEERISETKEIVLQQVAENKNDFVWEKIRDIDNLEEIRISAMSRFLNDFETGKSENRYIAHELPNKLDFDDNTFDLGLSSHFLLLYSQLGLDFHIQSINEMLRICQEIRIFPIVDLKSEKSDVLEGVLDFFSSKYHIEIRKNNYEFQKGGNEMLRIAKN